MNRFSEPEDGTLFQDILWADPEESIDGFLVSPRGAGYLFGKDVLNKFLQNNNLIGIIRSHQLCQEGYMV